MEFIIDSNGAPAVRFSKDKYINVLPVTKYQFERYIWKAAPLWCNYDEFVKETGRISPDDVTLHNFLSVFITGISCNEAMDYASYFKCRLPSAKEWDEAYDSAFCNRDLFAKTLEFMNSRPEAQIDTRLVRLLRGLQNLGLTRGDLNTVIGEIVLEFPREPYGRIYLKYNEKESALVTGQPSRETKGDNFGFLMIIK